MSSPLLAPSPDIILLDEATSGLDPISTTKVVTSLEGLKHHYTTISAPSSIQQLAQVTDHAAITPQAELVEWGGCKNMFTNPKDQHA